MSLVAFGLGSSASLLLTGGFYAAAPTPGEVGAAAVWAYVMPNGQTAEAMLTETHAYVMALARIHGLVIADPLVVTPTSRTAGEIEQTVETAGTTVTVTRL